MSPRIISRPGKLSKLLTVAALLWSAQLLPASATAAPQCHLVFQELSPDKAGAQILHERDPRLHHTPALEKNTQKQAQRTGVLLQKPAEKISAWLQHLETLSTQLQKNPRALAQVKDIFYKRFVIKPGDVPESYYQLQARIARERGLGEVAYSPAQKREMAETLIQDQQESLGAWIEYLVSAEAAPYPMWIKYWMLTGLTKLSRYNPAEGRFETRSKGTLTPFPELNAEALSLVVEMMLKKLDKKALRDLSDPLLSQLIADAHFGRLYGYALKSLGVEGAGSFPTNKGHWVVYPRGSDPGALVETLQGKHTGWCTAGEATARSHLSQGDFHVYYSLDKEGQPTLPRIAIRMEGPEIGEIRGVAKEQNLDPQISTSSVLSAKMAEFGEEGKLFATKSAHMRRLTEIDGKSKAKLPLTKEDLLFLYEINEPILGFGQQRDPRIQEIKSRRDVKSDLVLIYDGKYQREEISTSFEEWQSGNKRLHYGDLNLSHLKLLPPDLKLPEILLGKLDLSGLTAAPGVIFPRIVRGGLYLDALESAPGAKLPESVHGDLYLNKLVALDGLKLPETINGSVSMGALKSPEGLRLPKILKGDLNLSGLTSATGLELPDTVEGSLYLNRITSPQGLHLPRTIRGRLFLISLSSAQGLTRPQNFNIQKYFGPADF